MTVLPWLIAPVALALSRLLPAEGIGLGLRLGAATACLLLPGALISRALGVGGLAGVFAWSMTALFGALAPQVVASESRSILSAGPDQIARRIAERSAMYQEALNG